MEPNPYDAPIFPTEPPRHARFRIPWLVVGLGIGIVTMCLLLPAVSDLTGMTQTNVIIGSLVFGFLLGFVLDAVNCPPVS